MRTLGRIAYWLVALVLVSAILVSLARLTSPDTVTIGKTDLPVSRKYKEAVQLAFTYICISS